MLHKNVLYYEFALGNCQIYKRGESLEFRGGHAVTRSRGRVRGHVRRGETGYIYVHFI